MKNYLYPGNLKEQKTFLFLNVWDMVVLGFLVVFFVLYSANDKSFITLLVPSLFLLLKCRVLENNTNLWDSILRVFNYIVGSQQDYRWGKRD